MADHRYNHLVPPQGQPSTLSWWDIATLASIFTWRLGGGRGWMKHTEANGSVLGPEGSVFLVDISENVPPRCPLDLFGQHSILPPKPTFSGSHCRLGCLGQSDYRGFLHLQPSPILNNYHLINGQGFFNDVNHTLFLLLILLNMFWFWYDDSTSFQS